MNYVGWGFMGMHALWWLFWIALIVVFFALIEPVPRSRRRVSPLEVLQRRYAAGEISDKEYEERKAKLQHDAIPHE
ncbi:MAG: SHOCT domain-containing protein [Gammaproteobacteria bacterium]|nr:SHOCT domain-containing protein [Gammaproteobacteria bacterium]